MCGKVISGADYEQINSFGGGGFFKRTANFSSRTELPEHKKGRGTNAAAEAVSPPERISNEPPNGFRTNLLTARRPNGFRTIRSDRFRTVVRTYFGRLPGGVSDCHSEGFRQRPRVPRDLRPHRPDKSRTASRRNFRSSSRTDFRSPDGFRAAIRTNHNSDAPPPRKSHRKAGGIPSGATCGRNRLTQTSGSAAPPTCIRLSAPAPRRTRARK